MIRTIRRQRIALLAVTVIALVAVWALSQAYQYAGAYEGFQEANKAGLPEAVIIKLFYDYMKYRLEDSKSAYALLSDRVARVIALETFDEGCRKQEEAAEMSVPTAIGRLRSRGNNLVRADVEFHIHVIKGKKADTTGTSKVVLYATQENGEWKVVDPRLLEERRLSYDEDPAQLAEDFCLDWAGYPKPESPALRTEEGVRIFDVAGNLVEAHLTQWQSPGASFLTGVSNIRRILSHPELVEG